MQAWLGQAMESLTRQGLWPHTEPGDFNSTHIVFDDGGRLSRIGDVYLVIHNGPVKREARLHDSLSEALDYIRGIRMEA